jgi:LacI family transcriptional regulator
MLVPSLTWPWIADVVQGAVDVLESDSYGLLMFTCNRGDESMRQFATHVSAKSFDGLLVIEPENTLDYITELHQRGLPVVLIDDRGHQPLFPSVATTNRDGGEDAARHLISTGRMRPLMITGTEAFGCTQERSDGFRAAYGAAGVRLGADRVVEGDFTFDCGRLAVKQAIASDLDFDAIFAHNDLSAGGAIQALRELGRRVPGDIAVVGFDDVPAAIHTDPPLTTIRQPLRQMGATAARMLLSQLAGARLPQEPTVIPTTLVIRGSTTG